MSSSSFRIFIYPCSQSLSTLNTKHRLVKQFSSPVHSILFVTSSLLALSLPSSSPLDLLITKSFWLSNTDNWLSFIAIPVSETCLRQARERISSLSPPSSGSMGSGQSAHRISRRRFESSKRDQRRVRSCRESSLDLIDDLRLRKTMVCHSRSHLHCLSSITGCSGRPRSAPPPLSLLHAHPSLSSIHSSSMIAIDMFHRLLLLLLRLDHRWTMSGLHHKVHMRFDSTTPLTSPAFSRQASEQLWHKNSKVLAPRSPSQCGCGRTRVP